MKDSQFRMRHLAATLYGIKGIDATDEQIKGARKALQWYREGKSVSLIRLLLRIKTPAKPCADEERATGNLMDIMEL